MNALTNWVHRHQVAAFFILAFAITWGGRSCPLTTRRCSLCPDR